jgi:hypothetical protein
MEDITSENAAANGQGQYGSAQRSRWPPTPGVFLPNLSSTHHQFCRHRQPGMNLLETSHPCLLSVQSINTIECPEFRSLLLLLCQDLQDKDIPQLTKLRESIVQAWERWFKILKQELSICSVVSERSTFGATDQIKFFIGGTRKGQFHS